MSLNRDRGKRAEKKIAELVGGRRIGTMCREDVMHPEYSIEVKSRQACVIEGWMQQAEKNKEKTKKPLLIIHLHNKQHEQDIVCMRLRDAEFILKNNGLGVKND